MPQVLAPVLLLLLLLGTSSFVPGSAVEEDPASSPLPSTPPSAPRPRVYVYSMPPHLSMEKTTEKGIHPGTELLQRLLRSPFHEPDPSHADYFWIPGSGRFKSKSVMMEVLDHVRTAHPWWNMSVARGEVRHILVTTRDSDPGESFGWPLNVSSFPPDLNPVSPSRSIMFLTFNGMRDGAAQGKDHCVVCFQPGKDIMIPKFQGICNGPLCGVNLPTLRAKSIWSHPPEQLQAELGRRRKRLMFFGGSTLDHHDFTGRGGVALYFAANKRYLIQVSSSTAKRRLSFPDAMLNSEFCFSPLGGNGGPTDRYVPGIMYGCIPIMVNTSHTWKHRTPHSLPLEEVLPWHTFSTLVDNWDIANLEKQIQCLIPRIPQMRAALQAIWPSLVYSSLNKLPFLNESGDNDAFATLMRVLDSRIDTGYAPPRSALDAFTHPGTSFPCRRDSPLQLEAISPFV